MEFAERVPRRRLGVHGPEVPLLALGSWNTWDRMDREDAARLVRLAVDRGVDMFDVAHYNFGPHAENAVTDVLFGQAVRDAGIAREDYLLCGKLWLWEYPASSFAEQIKVSLGRVGTDHADMVVVGDFMERPDLKTVVADVSELVRAGRFASWGVNNWSAGDVLFACRFATAEGLVPPSFAQLKYNLARRSVPEGTLYARLFAEEGLALQASDVLEGGILAGKSDPERKIGADPGGIRDRIRAALPEIQRIADGFGVTPAQLAIAFCLAHPAVANVLVGVSRISQFENNLAALGLCARYGEELRTAAAGLWLDEGVVDPAASWGTDVPAPPADDDSVPCN
ncbi:aldo/keto reductase [Actinomadura meridiana]|uniref:Aldo/keto reductase n=1 Tax=Actinomadura meridiana TaxID=559626 RepID=A0ABP8BT92_9ACTN